MLATVILPIAISPVQVHPIVQEIRERLTNVPYTVLSAQYNTEHSLAMVNAERSADKSKIRVTFQTGRTAEHSDRIWSSVRPNGNDSSGNTGFSGLPIGNGVFLVDTPGTLSLRTKCGVDIISIQVDYRGSGPINAKRWSDQHRAADAESLEGVARNVLGTSAGHKSETTSSTQVGGALVSTIVGPNGSRLVNLRQFCEARGASLVVNQTRGTASTSINGSSVILPLGAYKIKRGSQWISTDDIVLQKSGSWYVSVDALITAFGGQP